MRSGCVFDLPSLESEITRLSEESQQPGFWDDSRHAQKIMRRLTALQEQVDRWRGMSRRATDLTSYSSLPSRRTTKPSSPKYRETPPASCASWTLSNYP